MKNFLIAVTIFIPVFASAQSLTLSALKGTDNDPINISQDGFPLSDKNPNFNCVAYGLPAKKEDNTFISSGFASYYSVRAPTIVGAVLRANLILSKAQRITNNDLILNGKYDIECRPQ